MTVVALALFGGLLYSLINFAKSIRAKDKNSYVTQLIVWGAGLILVFLFVHSMFGDQIKINDELPLSKLGNVETAIIGLSASSLVSGGYDVKKALDNNDSAKTPPLTKL